MSDSIHRAKPNKQFSAVLYSFSQNTSIHGIRFLGEKHIFILRRLIWFLLVCTSTGLLAYQITDRVIYYYSRPVTVNVKVNYNSSVQFPAVTICNQNAFKATLAAKRNWYRVLEKMYSNGDTMIASELDNYNVSDVTLDQLYLQTAHKKEDFIIKCIFKGKPCDASNFTQVITDHGVCYTFTTNQENGFISSPGIENGLKLTLNVEQYEYMPGPHDAAGIKMLVHTPGEFPLVHALGQAIPTGNHVFAGIKLNMINNRPYPYGNCGSKELVYGAVYSSEACRLDCQTRIVEETCQCRNAYMMSVKGLPRICTLKHYIGCLKNATENSDLWQCDCPVPCSFQIYESELSYASTSYYSIDKLLETSNITALRKSLLDAKEISAMMDKRIFEKTESLVNELKNEYSVLYTTVLKSLRKSAVELEKQMAEEFYHNNDIYNFKERLYRYQIYNVEKNFIRAREAMDERTFHIVGLAYAEFGLAIQNKVKKLMNETDPDIRRFLYISAMEMLENRMEVVYMCMKNYSDLYNAYRYGTKIFNYQFENIPRSHNNYSVPEELMKSSVNHDEYAVKYGPLLGERINQTISRLETLQQEVVGAYFDDGNTTLGSIENAVAEFYQTMRRFLFAKSVFDKFIVEWPVGILNNRLESFNSLWGNLDSHYDNVLQNLRSMIEDLKNVNETLVYIHKNVINTIQDYLLYKNNTKFSVAGILSSKTINQKISNIQSVFDQVRTREHGIKDILALIREEEIDFWTSVVQDNDSIRYYEFVNNTELTVNLSDILDEIEINSTNNQEMSKFSDIIQNTDKLFLDTFEKVADDFTSFKHSIKIDNEFLRQNVLKLDIFYRQMSYEQIDQQKAYDIFALICDIGGSMGLFIGASVLSLFELLDLFMSQSALRTRRKLFVEVKGKQSYS